LPKSIAVCFFIIYDSIENKTTEYLKNAIVKNTEDDKIIQTGETNYSLTPKSSPSELIHREIIKSEESAILPVESSWLVSNTAEIAEVARTEDWSQSVRDNIDTIPRVSLRAILYVFVFLIAGLIPWLMFAKVDEIGTAKGRLEPKGNVIRLDSPVSGTVKSIEVKAGQQVTKGTSLLQLDAESINTQLQQERQKLSGLEAKVDRLSSLKDRQLLLLQTQKQQNQAQQFEKQALIDRAKQNVTFLQSNNTNRLAEHEARLEQAQQSIETAKSASQVAKIREQAAKEKVPRYRQAFEQGALSKDLLAEAEQNAQESQANITQTASEMESARSQYREQQQGYEQLQKQIATDLAQAKLSLQEQERGYQSLVEANKLTLLNSQEELNQTAAEMATVSEEINLTKSSIDALEYQLKQRTIAAPVSGTLYQLSIAKPGAVLQLGQTVAQIAPQDSPLILKAKISSKESGFLKVGLPVKLKFDAYPFQDYGSIPGRLTWIAPDSKVAEDSSEFYEIEIQLERNYIQDDRKRIVLAPGQTATAEVVIRQRRLSDMLLSPVKNLQKSGLQF
jgi:hemolysin D